jgi:hypothetical protein
LRQAIVRLRAPTREELVEMVGEVETAAKQFALDVSAGHVRRTKKHFETSLSVSGGDRALRRLGRLLPTIAPGSEMLEYGPSGMWLEVRAYSEAGDPAEFVEKVMEMKRIAECLGLAVVGPKWRASGQSRAAVMSVSATPAELAREFVDRISATDWGLRVEVSEGEIPLPRS